MVAGAPRGQWPTLAVALAVAAYAPFDAWFSVVTQDRPVLRLLLIALLTLTGARMADRLGFRLVAHGARRPLLIGVAAAAGVALWVALLDGVLFRSTLPHSYIAFISRPLGWRLGYFMPRAYLENILYRLFAFSLLAGLLLPLVPGPRWRWAKLGAAMVLVQCFNIWLNVIAFAATAPTPASLGYDALRYVAPGVVWAILFVRNGFVVAEVASVGCHLFLQPLFSLLFPAQ